MNPIVTNLAYLLASVLFIFGLKGLTHPRTAVRGNRLGAFGMLIAIVVTLVDRNVMTYQWIIAGLALGTVIGAVMAVKIEMTAMPELVAVFNGFGGVASALVAGAELFRYAHGGTVEVPVTQFAIAAGASGLIGMVTFTGSMIAFIKLRGFAFSGNVKYPGDQVVKALFALACLALIVMIVGDPSGQYELYWYVMLVSAVLGVLVVIPIGGADMPVVITLLNSYSGLAAAATGFVLDNTVLIIAGSLVGASGIILTLIMCKAMNRSLNNVLFGTWGGDAMASVPGADEIYEGKIKATSAEEVAMMLDGLSSVIIVPGYGLAVAQAQHAVRDLANMLKANGTDVKYAIHPVAGRMPGHMNVLLAEADVPYDELVEMDLINPAFAQCDLAIVLGANDVVNPSAREDPTSPIAGMPILDVDYARTVVVIKRSLSPGFAGIPNPLFAKDNTLMFFGDAKQNMLDLIAAIKDA